MDLVRAVILLAATAPLAALVAIGILLTSGRPVVYRQVRLGRNLRPSAVFKFRTKLFNPLAVLGGPVAASACRSAQGPAPLPAARRCAIRRTAAAAALAFGFLLQGSAIYRAEPVLSAGVEALNGLGQELPADSRLVAATPAIRYWAELLTGLPVLSPWLYPQRMAESGPVFLLLQTSGPRPPKTRSGLPARRTASAGRGWSFGSATASSLDRLSASRAARHARHPRSARGHRC